MKYTWLLFLTSLMLASPLSAQENTDSDRENFTMAERTGYPGDNFNLQAALILFKESKNLQEFEQQLNLDDTNVNNLDLNQDGYIDYIKVVNLKENESFAIVLQVDISAQERQDIAVIEIEKYGYEHAKVQIVGNADVYGKTMVVQLNDPTMENNLQQEASDYSTQYEDQERSTFMVNINDYPTVRYIYGPNYSPWISPYYYGYYPTYYQRRAPFEFGIFIGASWGHYHQYDNNYYHTEHYNPYQYSHAAYEPRRSHSPYVRNAVEVAHPNDVNRRPRNNRTEPAINAPRPNRDNIAPRPNTATPNTNNPMVRPGRNTAPGVNTAPQPSNRDPRTERPVYTAPRPSNTPPRLTPSPSNTAPQPSNRPIRQTRPVNTTPRPSNVAPRTETPRVNPMAQPSNRPAREARPFNSTPRPSNVTPRTETPRVNPMPQPSNRAPREARPVNTTPRPSNVAPRPSNNNERAPQNQERR